MKSRTVELVRKANRQEIEEIKYQQIIDGFWLMSFFSSLTKLKMQVKYHQKITQEI